MPVVKRFEKNLFRSHELVKNLRSRLLDEFVIPSGVMKMTYEPVLQPVVTCTGGQAGPHSLLPRLCEPTLRLVACSEPERGDHRVPDALWLTSRRRFCLQILRTVVTPDQGVWAKKEMMQIEGKQSSFTSRPTQKTLIPPFLTIKNHSPVERPRSDQNRCPWARHPCADAALVTAGLGRWLKFYKKKSFNSKAIWR